MYMPGVHYLQRRLSRQTLLSRAAIIRGGGGGEEKKRECQTLDGVGPLYCEREFVFRVSSFPLELLSFLEGYICIVHYMYTALYIPLFFTRRFFSYSSVLVGFVTLYCFPSLSISGASGGDAAAVITALSLSRHVAWSTAHALGKLRYINVTFLFIFIHRLF